MIILVLIFCIIVYLTLFKMDNKIKAIENDLHLLQFRLTDLDNEKK